MKGNIRNSSFYCFLVFITLGVCCLFFGFNMNNEINNMEDKYVSINAFVVDYDYKSFNSDEAYIIYEYNVDNEIYRVKSNVSTNVLPSKGDTKIIMYDPNNPYDVLFLNRTYIILYVFGIFSILAGFVVIIIYFKVSYNNEY